jgi:hypothetical protein
VKDKLGEWVSLISTFPRIHASPRSRGTSTPTSTSNSIRRRRRACVTKRAGLVQTSCPLRITSILRPRPPPRYPRRQVIPVALARTSSSVCRRRGRSVGERVRMGALEKRAPPRVCPPWSPFPSHPFGWILQLHQEGVGGAPTRRPPRSAGSVGGVLSAATGRGSARRGSAVQCSLHKCPLGRLETGPANLQR